MTSKNTTRILFLCLLTLVFSTPRSAKAQSGAPAHPHTVRITIESEPAGSVVAVNRQIIGNTPVNVTLPVGKHLVRVSRDANWMPFIEEREFSSDETLRVTLVPRTGHLYSLGKKAFDKKEYASARKYFRQVTEVSDSTMVPESFFFLGMMDRREHRNEEMVRNFKRYLELNPKRGDFVLTFPEIFPEVHNYAVSVSQYLLGEHYRNAGEWGNAATAYKLSIPSWERLVDKNLKPTFENIKALENVADTTSDYQTPIKLGYLYELKGMLRESAESYRKASRKLFNQSPDFEQKMGDLVR